VLLYLVVRAAADGTDIFPTKQRIASELSLSKRSIQLAITTLLLPTPFGGPPILHKDGEVMTRKGPADKYRIDVEALWKLPEIEVDDDVLKRTEFTSGVNDVHLTREPSSSHPVNDIHPERPSEKPMKDLVKDRQVFSAPEDKGFNAFVTAFPEKPEDYENTRQAYRQALNRGATDEAIKSAALSFARQVERGLRSPVSPSHWLQRDEWGSRTTRERWTPGGYVR
jgi:hypothetical protein